MPLGIHYLLKLNLVNLWNGELTQNGQKVFERCSSPRE
jgi:hypothetical protein